MLCHMFLGSIGLFCETVDIGRNSVYFVDAENYTLNEFDKLLARADWNRVVLEGKTILDIGSGNSIAAAIIAYAYGANAILLDVGPFAKILPNHTVLYEIY